MEVVGSDDSAFCVELRARSDELDRLAYTQKVPGLDRDDVRAELVQCLWNAHRTYRPEAGTSLGQWWWVLWTNRKADLIESFFAQKNPNPLYYDGEVLEGMIDEVVRSMAPLVTLEDLCPGTTKVEKAVWALLANGFTGVEVRRLLHISTRKFYAIIDSWTTPEVHAILAGP